MTSLPTLSLLLLLGSTDPGGIPTPGDRSAASPDQAPWPQWRGPSRDGRDPGRTWPDRLEGRLERLWRVDLGESYAGPIVTHDRVFSVETLDKKKEVVRALDLETGEELWATEWQGSLTVPFFAAKNGSWVRATPAFDGKHLYVAGMRDVVACLDGESGDLVWRVDFCERYQTPLPSFGMVCSPLLVGDHLFVQAAGSLVCLDRATGETVWRSLEDGGGMDSTFASPYLAEVAGRTQLLVLTRTEMNGVDPATGEVLWTRPIRAFRGMNILTPVAWGDSIFTSAYGGRSELLDLTRGEDGAFTVESRWNSAPQGYMTSPVIHDGHAYLFLRSNRFACLRLEDGEERWTSPPTGDEYWSLALQGDRILALTDTGMLRLVKASPEAYEVLDETQVSEDPTWAHLALAEGRVLVRELSGMSCFVWHAEDL